MAISSFRYGCVEVVADGTEPPSCWVCVRLGDERTGTVVDTVGTETFTFGTRYHSELARRR